MNDALRKDAAENPGDYIGTAFKCNYMELTEDAIREPIFIEFREDKAAEECLYSEVFKQISLAPFKKIVYNIYRNKKANK